MTGRLSYNDATRELANPSRLDARIASKPGYNTLKWYQLGEKHAACVLRGASGCNSRIMAPDITEQIPQGTACS